MGGKIPTPTIVIKGTTFHRLTLGSFLRLSKELDASVASLSKTLNLPMYTPYNLVRSHNNKGTNLLSALLNDKFNLAIYENFNDFFMKEQDYLETIVEQGNDNVPGNLVEEYSDTYKFLTYGDNASTDETSLTHEEAILSSNKNTKNVTKNNNIDIKTNNKNNNIDIKVKNTRSTTENVRMADALDCSAFVDSKGKSVYKSISILNQINRETPQAFLFNLQEILQTGSIYAYLTDDTFNIDIKYTSRSRYHLINPLFIEIPFKSNSIVILLAKNDSRLVVGFSEEDSNYYGVKYDKVLAIIKDFILPITQIINISKVSNIPKTLSKFAKFLKLNTEETETLIKSMTNNPKQFFTNISKGDNMLIEKLQGIAPTDLVSKEVTNTLATQKVEPVNTVATQKEEPLTKATNKISYGANLVVNNDNANNNIINQKILAYQEQFLAKEQLRNNLKNYLDVKYGDTSLTNDVKNIIIEEILYFYN